MSNLYQFFKTSGRLDLEINRRIGLPGQSALQWPVAEVAVTVPKSKALLTIADQEKFLGQDRPRHLY